MFYCISILLLIFNLGYTERLFKTQHVKSICLNNIVCQLQLKNKLKK